MQANYVTGLPIPREFKLCESIGEIQNKADCIRYLTERIANSASDSTSIIEELNKRESDESSLSYFTIDGVMVDEDDVSAHYRLFDTGYKTPDNHAIYFSFYRYGKNWRGAYVVTMSEFNMMADKYYKEQTEKAEYKPYISERKETPFENRLKKKTSKKIPVKPEDLSLSDINKRWQEVINYVRSMCTSPTWVFDTSEKLATYLYALETRICGILKRVSAGEAIPKGYIIFNKSYSHIYVNTGITNKLSKPIYIACELGEDNLSFTSVSVIRCRDMLVDLGFSVESASEKPKKISFFKENEVPVFMGTIFDVDIENPKSVNHCMVDNVGRLPEYIQAMSEEERIELYFKKLQLSFERQSVDSFYFKPFYCLVNDSIEYIIPCYVNDDCNDEVEFGFILGRSPKGFWGVYTVLTAEQCKGNVQVLQPFQKF